MTIKRGVIRIRQSKSMWTQEVLAHKEVLPGAEVPGNDEPVGHMKTQCSRNKLEKTERQPEVGSREWTQGQMLNLGSPLARMGGGSR